MGRDANPDRIVRSNNFIFLLSGYSWGQEKPDIIKLRSANKQIEEKTLEAREKRKWWVKEQV